MTKKSIEIAFKGENSKRRYLFKDNAYSIDIEPPFMYINDALNYGSLVYIFNLNEIKSIEFN